MKNEKIGTLGEAFIQKHVELGIDFDTAWDDWQRIQDKLMFVIVQCPEVQFYDDRRISDREERLRIRQFAKSTLGKDIRSSDVAMLGRVAAWLQVEVPVRPYHMDRGIVAEWLARHAGTIELKYGASENVAETKDLAASDEAVEGIARSVEMLAINHGLWAVPPRHLMELYINHCQRLLETSYVCDACGEEMAIPVDHSAGSWQQFEKVCPKCSRRNSVCMSVDLCGEARVLWSFVDGEVAEEDASES